MSRPRCTMTGSIVSILIHSLMQNHHPKISIPALPNLPPLNSLLLPHFFEFEELLERCVIFSIRDKFIFWSNSHVFTTWTN